MEFTPRSAVCHCQLHHAFRASAGKRALRAHEGFLYRCDKRQAGRLEAANGGSVFLDEIAELSPALQSKFLRFLEDERFERVGGEETINVDARIIAATNRSLPQEISSERFRSDLYYRLNVISLRVPALRERPEDILPLAEMFLTETAARNSRSGLQFSDDSSQGTGRLFMAGQHPRTAQRRRTRSRAEPWRGAAQGRSARHPVSRRSTERNSARTFYPRADRAGAHPARSRIGADA